MKLGLFGINTGERAAPEVLLRAARAAEDAGIESVWTGEHVVLPDPRVPPSPMEPRDPALDPFVALSFVASATSRLRLATGIIIVPQRNPVVMAKQVASLDVLSGGRFVLGVGVGYLQPEFEAIGANYPERGAVTDEHLDAMGSLLYDEKPSFQGRHVRFDGVDAHPRPVQRPVPLVVGGHSAPAFRRAVTKAQGWYGFALRPDAVKGCVDGLKAAADQAGRPDHLGPLEITVTPLARPTRENVEAYADLGVDRLVPMITPGDADGTRTIEEWQAAAG